MNITEANATNTLMRYLTSTKATEQQHDNARTAAAFLADRAQAALQGAGPGGDKVRAEWPPLRRRRVTRRGGTS